MTLLSLASRQIWPQVLAVLHFRPQRLILLHSQNETESRGPAERLKEFFEKKGDLAAANILLRETPHDDFYMLADKIAQAADEFGLDGTNCQVNLTGGNKLMVLAAVEWCRLNSVPAFYLELDRRLFLFRPQGKEFLPNSDYKLDANLADSCEPIDLLRCQIGTAEIRDAGQRLTLKRPCPAFSETDFYTKVVGNFDFRKLLCQDVPEPTKREGDPLEYATAFALLSLGIPVIQRSVKLKSRVLRRSQDDEGELDLIFTWQGKLWLVDCKDKRAAQQKPAVSEFVTSKQD
jgi:hypothetical protein